MYLKLASFVDVAEGFIARYGTAIGAQDALGEGFLVEKEGLMPVNVFDEIACRSINVLLGDIAA